MKLLLKRKVEKSVARLPDTVYERVIRKINSLVEDPRPTDSKKTPG